LEWQDYRARFKINKGYITILDLHVPEEGRNEEADKFYQQLQGIKDKIKKIITFSKWEIQMPDMETRD